MVNLYGEFEAWPLLGTVAMYSGGLITALWCLDARRGGLVVQERCGQVFLFITCACMSGVASLTYFITTFIAFIAHN